jgi:protein-disulfide isomerase
MSKQGFRVIAGFGVAALMAVSGCQGGGQLPEMNKKLDDIIANQKALSDKLTELEDKVGKAGPAQPQQAKPDRPDPNATYKVPVGDAYVKGPADAKVTIIEWSDFECPFCKRVGPTLDQIQKEYGDNVRVAFKHQPLSFHKSALPAALAAEAAGRQGKFWEMHDKLFGAEKGALTEENFAKWAKEIGLNTSQFKKDMEDEALKKKIQQQSQEGMTVGARGTPAFFVNGRFLSGAQPFESFKKVIDEEMKKADQLIAAGTPKDKLYEKVIEKGKTKV